MLQEKFEFGRQKIFCLKDKQVCIHYGLGANNATFHLIKVIKPGNNETGYATSGIAS